MFSIPIVLGLYAFAPDEAAIKVDDLKFLPDGVSKLVQPAMHRLLLSSSAVTQLRRGPAGPVTWWGVLPFGPRGKSRDVTIAIGEKSGSPPKLWIDLNADADLTNDPETALDMSKYAGNGKGYYTAELSLPLENVTDKPVRLTLLRYAESDAARRKLPKDVIFCTPDYAWSGTLTIAGKKYPLLMTDDVAHGDFTFPSENAALTLSLDLNHNGKYENDERFSSDRSIDAGGMSLALDKVSADGREIKLVPAETIKRVALGEPQGKARPFTGKTLEGDELKFPDAFKGKIVLLDFWATWCGPCVAEIPNVLKAHEKFHKDGFEVLGVSLDRPGSKAKLAQFVKDRKMPWRQIYPGDRQAGEWGVQAIPQMYIIDGDTGDILASGAMLRAGGLESAVEAALKKKFAKNAKDKDAP